MEQLPAYTVGSHIAALCTWNSCYHSAVVVDQRGTNNGREFYVHYLGYNKRLDEWLPFSRISCNSETVTACKSLAADGEASAAASSLLAAAEQRPEACGKGERKLTRNLKRRYDEIHCVQKAVEELAPMDQSLEKEHEEKTKVKNIQVVELGKYEMDAWYYSPYPEGYAHQQKLYICEFCLKYMKKKLTLERHKVNCDQRHPPGNEIYSTTPLVDQGNSALESGQSKAASIDGTTEVFGEDLQVQNLTMFEVDGRQNKIYCQNLCLLAKLFLDHKTLYYDVDSFLFYVLTEQRGSMYHPVGYFSKEKCSAEEYNLACILILPPFQRNGYGRFLISFAYEISKKEGKVGTPERPLSDLGQVSFRSYWTRVLLEILRDHGGNLSIKDLSSMTAIRNDDIISTLQSLNLIKYWKGQHIVSLSPKTIEEHLKSVIFQPTWSIDPSKLQWTPVSCGIKRLR